MDWFKNTWVAIVGFVLLIIGTALLYLGGVGKVDLNQTVEMVIAIVDSIGLLIIFIRKLIQKKDSAKKKESAIN